MNKLKWIGVAILISLYAFGIYKLIQPNYKTTNLKYEVTFNNGDKDTISYNGDYIREYLHEGDLTIIAGGLDQPIIAASGVRTYKIVK